MCLRLIILAGFFVRYSLQVPSTLSGCWVYMCCAFRDVLLVCTVCISQKWEHPSHFWKYLMSFHGTTLKEWHFDLIVKWSVHSLCNSVNLLSHQNNSTQSDKCLNHRQEKWVHPWVKMSKLGPIGLFPPRCHVIFSATKSQVWKGSRCVKFRAVTFYFVLFLSF